VVPLPLRCDRCFRERRCPFWVGVAFLEATRAWTLPADLIVGTVRCRCGRTLCVTWGLIERARLRLAS